MTECQWCKRVFKQVKKHPWRCKQRPVDLGTEPLVREETVRHSMSEQGTSQVHNHSATKGPASSVLHFHVKDKEPLASVMEITKKLMLPTAADRGVWRGIDEDLEVLCNNLTAGDDEKRLEETEKMIYSYLADRFGQETQCKGTQKHQETEKRETKALRLAKRDAKKNKKDFVAHEVFRVCK